MEEQVKKYPEGHYVILWTAICTLLGIVISIIIGGVSLLGYGFNIGIVIGLIIGSWVE